jgi:hypothetical protein
LGQAKTVSGFDSPRTTALLDANKKRTSFPIYYKVYYQKKIEIKTIACMSVHGKMFAKFMSKYFCRFHVQEKKFEKNTHT